MRRTTNQKPLSESTARLVGAAEADSFAAGAAVFVAGPTVGCGTGGGVVRPRLVPGPGVNEPGVRSSGPVSRRQAPRPCVNAYITFLPGSKARSVTATLGSPFPNLSQLVPPSALRKTPRSVET